MNASRLKTLIVACEYAWLAVSLAIVSRILSAPEGSGVLASWPSILTAALLMTFVLVKSRLNALEAGWGFPTIASRLFLAVPLLLLTVVALSTVVGYQVTKSELAWLAVLLFVGLFIIRVGFRTILTSDRRFFAKRRVVIVGNGRIAKELDDKIRRHPEMLSEVVGFLYPSSADTNDWTSADGNATNCTSLQVSELFELHGVDEVILATGAIEHPEMLNLIARCREAGIQINLIPQCYELYVTRPSLVDLTGLPLLCLNEKVPSRAGLFLKRTFDLLFGSLALLLSAPVLLSSALSVWGRYGRAFRKEPRCGRGGERFDMYRLNVDRNSPRLVGWEKYLNELSITELPQLLNVVLGDMSLVGPRPETRERVQRYSDWQRQRLSVKPGLTGLAQVQGLREHHTSEEKARFDLQYILGWTFWLDCTLLLETVWTLSNRLISSSAEAPGPPTQTASPREADFSSAFPSAQREEALHVDRP